MWLINDVYNAIFILQVWHSPCVWRNKTEDLSTLMWRTSSPLKLTTPCKKSTLQASLSVSLQKPRHPATNVRWCARQLSSWTVTRRPGTATTKQKLPKSVHIARSLSSPPPHENNTCSNVVLSHAKLVLVMGPATAWHRNHLHRPRPRLCHPLHRHPLLWTRRGPV